MNNSAEISSRFPSLARALVSSQSSLVFSEPLLRGISPIFIQY